MPRKKQLLHVRLPQKAEAVIGAEIKPGEAPPGVKPDPRTVTQDPALKPKKAHKAR